MSDQDPINKSLDRKLRYKEWLREYQKKRKLGFKKMGVCPSCQKRPAAENRTCCTQCLEDKKLAQKFGTAGPYRQLYAELFELQGGLCSICREAMTRPLLDHDHKTMEIRGLLCSNCNVGLGQFKDNPELIMRALKYLNENAGIGIKMKHRK